MSGGDWSHDEMMITYRQLLSKDISSTEDDWMLTVDGLMVKLPPPLSYSWE
jgi:hypothetical protein